MSWSTNVEELRWLATGSKAYFQRVARETDRPEAQREREAIRYTCLLVGGRWTGLVTTMNVNENEIQDQ